MTPAAYNKQRILGVSPGGRGGADTCSPCFLGSPSALGTGAGTACVSGPVTALRTRRLGAFRQQTNKRPGVKGESDLTGSQSRGKWFPSKETSLDQKRSPRGLISGSVVSVISPLRRRFCPDTWAVFPRRVRMPKDMRNAPCSCDLWSRSFKMWSCARNLPPAPCSFTRSHFFVLEAEGQRPELETDSHPGGHLLWLCPCMREPWLPCGRCPLKTVNERTARPRSAFERVHPAESSERINRVRFRKPPTGG